MSEGSFSSKRQRKGGRFFPALCNLLGTLILLAAIAACLPAVVPRLMGYEVYNVVSPSMEPEIPVGSVLYVERVSPVELAEGDVIAFHSGGSVIAHRVVTNQQVQGEITTKGDANAGEDMNAVAYEDVIGRVAYHFPMVGDLMQFFTGTVGKVYLILFAACGAMLNLLGNRLRKQRKAARE